MHKIIDNLLAEEQFTHLQNNMLGSSFPWFFSGSVADEEENDYGYFVHEFYDGCFAKSHHIELILPLLEQLDLKALIRCKANAFLKTEQLIQHPMHVDLPYEHKGAIFYLNTCDGKTVLENGEVIDSVANRLLLFDSSRPHASTTTTDAQRRVNININFM